VDAGEPVEQVELFVNGKLMGAVKKPPYRLTVDLGD